MEFQNVVSGTVISTTVGSGYTQKVGSGGTAIDTIIESGSDGKFHAGHSNRHSDRRLILSSWYCTESSATIFSGGENERRRTALDATINGGDQLCHLRIGLGARRSNSGGTSK